MTLPRVAVLAAALLVSSVAAGAPALETSSNSLQTVAEVTEFPTTQLHSRGPLRTTTSMSISSTTPSARHEETTPKYNKGGSSLGTDDWDYIESAAGTSPGARSVFQKERRRHEPENRRALQRMKQLEHAPRTHRHGGRHAHTARATPSPPPSPSWDDFCKEAAEEDDDDKTSPWVSDGSFHPKYEEVPGVGVYRLHAAPRSWAAARRACEREGAQLAVPNSRQEALALADIHNRCPRLLRSHFNDYQYLGAHDNYAEGRWETVVGDPLNETGYLRWGYNQPDNAHGEGENCLCMNRNSFYNDVPCWTELPFICEHV